MPHDAEEGYISEHLNLIPQKYPLNAVLRGVVRREFKLGFELHVIHRMTVGGGEREGGMGKKERGRADEAEVAREHWPRS